MESPIVPSRENDVRKRCGEYHKHDKSICHDPIAARRDASYAGRDQSELDCCHESLANRCRRYVYAVVGPLERQQQLYVTRAAQSSDGSYHLEAINPRSVSRFGGSCFVAIPVLEV